MLKIFHTYQAKTSLLQGEYFPSDASGKLLIWLCRLCILPTTDRTSAAIQRRRTSVTGCHAFAASFGWFEWFRSSTAADGASAALSIALVNASACQ